MDSISNQFPAWQKQIEQLYQENADFREMCQDYEEARSLLVTWTTSIDGATSTDVNPTTIEAYQTLLKELEAEILETLQSQFQPADSSKQDTTSPSTNAVEQGSEDD